MNDERFQKSKHCTINNSSSNKLKKCNNTALKSDYYLAEAAKVSLKNVLNGANKETIVAAAKLLNATKAFHFSPPPLPPPPPQPLTPPSSPATAKQQNKNIKSKIVDFESTRGAAGGFDKKLQQKVAVVNNGLSSLSTKAAKQTTTTATTRTTEDSKISRRRKINSMAAIASTPIIHVGGGGAIDAGLKMATDCEVIDYTLNNLKSNNNNNNTNINNNTNNNNNNNNNNSNNNNSRNNFDSRNSDHERQQYGGLYGGRLQFFKDGKFILELARSKDGERSGWVSVPRKPMRPPSATSSTITPTSATSLVAYAKNESSTSLSFSDDNSSIQSSPWQRDHCWKQATPKRNISKEMCLYFVRSSETQLTRAALSVARKKRRQPLNKLTLTLGIFERLENYDEKSSIVVERKLEKNEESTTATLNSDESTPKDLNKSSLEQSVDKKNFQMEVNEEHVCDQTDTITTKTDNEHKEEKDNIELNTNGREHNKTSESVEEHKEVETTAEVQHDIGKNNNNTEQENNIEIVVKLNTRWDVKRKRLKVYKERAKLETIVQKLNQRVLKDTEQQFKLTTTTEIIGNGLTKSTVSMHKATTAAATRLADFHHQHVSPRKRILRELEKVTLEDAGGKRSRAKLGNNNFSLSTTNSSSPTRIQTKLPITTSAMDISHEKTTTTTTTTADSNTTTTTTTTPRLYSSYSIHSLLSGSSSSSSSNKKPTTISQQVDGYQRNLMLSSPKSPEHGKLYKKRSPPYTHSPTAENSHHHHAQQHLTAEYHQGFHTPYMLSPATATTSATVTTNYNNIPKNVSTPSNTYTSQSSAFTAAAVNLLSPQSSPAAVDSTPRTVPKKTQSIRRQFASPTSVTAASSPTTATTTTTALNDNDMYMPHNSLQQHWPTVSTAPPMHTPLHFYMYPPAPPLSNGTTHSGNDAAAVAAAAAAAAYIPYYHPYFTTLAALRQNPLWLHHYAGHHAAPSTRLSPPTPPTYAGNSSNYLAAANSANMAPYMPNPNSRAMMGNNTNKNLTYNNNNSKLINSTTTTVSKHRISTPTSTISSSSPLGSGAYKSGSIKDEPSSDVPLNLSKH